MAETLGIGILGLGTVGGGVARLLTEHAERLERRSGRRLEIRRVAVRDVEKPRSFSLSRNLLTDDPGQVVRAPDVDVVVELIGGIEPARTLIIEALDHGKHVVTANKSLLCEHGPELYERARRRERCIAFEAAVAGGIPIIAAVGQSMAANQLQSIEAILNGTSNFILTEMLARRASYREILAEAQRLGYAEADPTMDIDGTDAAQKLVLLVQLAFGTRITPSQFLRRGIDTLELADLLYADEMGYRVKLLAVARIVRGRLEVHVEPTLLRADRPIAKVDGALNIIALRGDAVGPTWFSGPGAGALPTASAVVADLVDIAVGRAQLTFPVLDLWRLNGGYELLDAEHIARRYYLRFNIEDRPGVLAEIAAILGRHHISIASVIQHEAPEIEDAAATPPPVPLVIMTHRTTEGQMRAAEAELQHLPALRPPHVRMPVSD
ncbi:MAG: homoserine dehydrogenase [Planctomycetota bacterium]|nr:MAG: homoserine dehydrogenase [Planctomycetota bacterium]